jgi:hypothetical protein
MQKIRGYYQSLTGFGKFVIGAFIGAVIFSFAKTAFATPGGLDGAGCHHPGRGAYHCHTGKQVQGQATRAQCAAMQNDGLCTRFQRKRPTEGR